MATVSGIDRAICNSLQRCVPGAKRCSVVEIRELSTGLSPARVWRVRYQQVSTTAVRRTVLKVPDYNKDKADDRDEDLLTREWALHRSDLPAQLEAAGVAIPPLLGSEQVEGMSWLWLEDVADGDPRDLKLDRIATIGGDVSRLHACYVANEDRLAGIPWLSRDEILRYERFVPAALETLRQLESRGDDEIIPLVDISRLQSCLRESSRAVRAQQQLPVSLAHGDFHIGNVVVDSSDRCTIIDWAHCGMAPIGTDAASFVELYSVGARKRVDQQPFADTVFERYVEGLWEIQPEESWMPVCLRAWGLWNVLRGLPIRLGHALPALLEDRVPPDLKGLLIEDIRSGCDRALRFFMDEL